MHEKIYMQSYMNYTCNPVFESNYGNHSFQRMTHIYRPQPWGKVIFSEACVKNSVHSGGMRGGGGVAGGMHDRREHAWQGACMVGGVHGRRACVAGGMHGGGCAWQILWDTVNEWAVRILLECILVKNSFGIIVV